jgi:cytochrome c peroxidase
MLYESTLISDESPFDHFMGCPEPQCSPAIPPDFTALDSQQFFGLLVFSTDGQCSGCHSGPQFSGATRHVNDPEEQALLERMVMNDGGAALYDHGFYNIGVRPTAEDPGVGATDPFSNTLSLARQYMKMLKS